MYTKKQRVMSMAVGVLFLFMMFASLFYVVKEADHNCTGEDCPICATIHQAEQTLKNIGTGVVLVMMTDPTPMQTMLAALGCFLFLSSTSLVSQKVRLDN